MRFASILAALVFILTTSVYPANALNATIEVYTSDICATAPLCTYWYEDEMNRGITPIMTVTNNGYAPISISSAKLHNVGATIQSIPCILNPSEQAFFTITDPAIGSTIKKMATKHAVVFTITMIGD